MAESLKGNETLGVYNKASIRSPLKGANRAGQMKDYFYISEVDDREYLASLIKATLPALPKPKVKKNPMKCCEHCSQMHTTFSLSDLTDGGQCKDM